MMILLLVALIATLTHSAHVHTGVLDALADGRTANIWVQLPNKKFNPRNPEHLQSIRGRNERKIAHVNIMTEYANTMQVPIVSFLKEKKANFKKFWITNAFVIYDANLEIVKQLEATFPELISEIYVENVAHIEVPVSQKVEIGSKVNRKMANWNIEQVNAPDAWAAGYTGAGFVMGNIDTGVRWTHEALNPSYRGTGGSHAYNWHDPNGQQVPFDNNGHGTHVMGSMAGSLDIGIGMAYDAKWIAAKGCASNSCSQADLTSSGQFMAAPTDLNEQNPDPLAAPHVVQNSWGGGGGQTWFHPIIDSWLALDIVPSFSAGNSGPVCGSIGSPSDYEYAISVASNDQQRSLSSFSSRGPGFGSNHPWADQKPNLSGPGSSILSAWNTNDVAYNTISGTSMSGPHIAASTVLILGPIGPNGTCPTSLDCDNPNNCLCVEYVKQVLISTASDNFASPAGVPLTCGGVAWDTVPSYHYGYGILDVGAAIRKVAADLTKFNKH